jgi:hypothetical protein
VISIGDPKGDRRSWIAAAPRVEYKEPGYGVGHFDFQVVKNVLPKKAILLDHGSGHREQISIFTSTAESI